MLVTEKMELVEETAMELANVSEKLKKLNEFKYLADRVDAIVEELEIVKNNSLIPPAP